MNEGLIAPCGMNCAICSGYLAYQHDVKSRGIRMPYCIGCRPRDKKCAFLKKGCELLLIGRVEYCYECNDFPCERLERLDKRYRTYFKMSMIENLEYIKKNGINQFLEKEEERWKCPRCGGVICSPGRGEIRTFIDVDFLVVPIANKKDKQREVKTDIAVYYGGGLIVNMDIPRQRLDSRSG